jgi:Flp pilus assembly pilin Flp
MEPNMNVPNRIMGYLPRNVSLARGQGLAEYALILALIAIVAIIALIFLGGQVSKILSNVGHSV